jgi:class 3 adenylate cyclase/predicted ATPase
MEVGDWLRQLDLEQYIDAFAANAVDWAVLPTLTADDLREIGVAAVGDRRKLLNAIADLAASAAVRSSTPAASERPAQSVGPERRQLTVMFCDLVGSTPLAARFDPEDLREIVGAYYRTVADTVARFSGFIAKYMGDGVLVYFGYPEAHEEDAERAVRAGLALIEAIGGLDAPEQLQVRVGIASGLVVVGDLIGEGAAQERGVVGETPNLAARLQALAQPSTVVIAGATRRQLGALFDVEDLGRQSVAGFAEKQHPWRVLGESGVASRFEALRSGTTPLIGRDEELDLLLRRWHQAKAGEGRVVLISGEPGIGKSRLAAAIAEATETEQSVRLRWFSSPHHQDSSLHPFIAQLERAAGFGRDDSAEAKLAKLDAVLMPGAPGDDEMALLRELLSLPNRAAEPNLSPRKKRETLLAALLQQLAALAKSRPVLAMLEDAHWIDPTSRELLDLMVDAVRRLPVMLIITYRPEFQAAWGGQPHVMTLTLNRLGERDVTALVCGLAGNAPLGSEVVAEIVERTDGVPLFVEELTKAVLEHAGQDNRVASVLLASALPTLEVPATLHALLIARLDRLGTAAKEVAQIGAVLGREFDYELIDRVAQRPDLATALAALTDAGLLFCRGVTPLASYLFKHALVQDAAYSTLLRAHRQELHGRVAGVLGEHFADFVERQPELLAHHLTAAGAVPRAVEQWLRAGRHAATRSAHQEAIVHFDRGLALLSTQPETPSRDRLEIELQLAKGVSLISVKGFSSIEAADAYGRARDLTERAGITDKLVVALFGLWNFVRTSDFTAARDLSQKMLALTRNHDDAGLRLQAYHSAWTTDFFRGETVLGREHCDTGWRLYDFDQHCSHAFLYGGHDPGVCSRMINGLTGWLLGHPDQAQTSVDAGLALAKRLQHPFTLGTALLQASVFYQLCREPDTELQLLSVAESVATDQRLTLHIDFRILRGGALVTAGDLHEAVSAIRAGLAEQERPGAKLYRPLLLSILADALLGSGDPVGSLGAAAEALLTATETGEIWWLAEIHRLKGAALLATGHREGSEAAFSQALQLARRQQVKSLELRAAMSLARLRGEQGRRQEAQELLAPVYGWFSEGFDTSDLKDAKAVLDELA